MKLLLAEMTIIEAEEAFERTDLAILPVGATEAHGPHNPLFTDSNVALELSRRVGEKMNGMAIVAPLIPYGVNPIVMKFGGTITLRQETMLNLLRDVSNSLIHWGIRRIFFLIGHGGGNIPAIATVACELSEKGVLSAAPVWWEVAAKLNERWAPPDHGGFTETMVNLVAMPQGVRMDLYAPPNVGYQMTDKVKVVSYASIEFQGIKIPVYLPSAKLAWPYGFSEPKQGISSTEATKEEGERMLEAIAQYYADFLAEFRKAPLPACD